MPQLDRFGEPDREGFDVLLASEFVSNNGMLFRKATFKPDDIDSQLLAKSGVIVQREFNHTHMFLYAADIGVQREWCNELKAVWQERLASEFPDLKLFLTQATMIMK